MDEIRCSSKVTDPKEIEHVLKTYLDLFSAGCDFFKFLIAQNGVLEWFGRTIKGNQKIHDFLRYEVRSQYDHLNFNNAKASEPFECKLSHMATKQLPVEDNAAGNQFPIDNSFESDSSNLNTETITTSRTKDRRGPITPPSSAKRFKHQDGYSSNQSSTPLLNLEDYFERKTLPVQITSPVYTKTFTDLSKPSTKLNKTDDGYSGLRYLEAVGVLRSSIQPEFRSFRNTNALNGHDAWDRETRIQISYRVRLRDNDIQIALIVYQNVRQYSAVSKRNLMAEFEEVSTNEGLLKSRGSTNVTVRQSPSVERKIGRRLRLF